MKKFFKKAISLFMAVLILLAIIPISVIDLKASAVAQLSVTQEQAVNWALNNYKTVTGAYGTNDYVGECISLVKRYIRDGLKFGGSNAFIVPDNCACKMDEVAFICNNFTIIRSGEPRPGDIFVWDPGVHGASNPYGHVGIITSTYGNNYEYVDWTSHAANKGNTSGYSYLVRPNFTASKAPQYAYIYVDKLNYAVNETVTFHFNTDTFSHTNTLWIYCPDGSVLNYPNQGNDCQLAFGMAGYFEALVQAWNSVGEKCSTRISFYIGPPQYANIYTDKTEYSVNESVKFTFNTAAKSNYNTLWIYYPNGTSKYFQEVGSHYSMSFSTPGNYEALVEAWNDIGSKTSIRIKFKVTHAHSYTSSITTQPTCTTKGVRTYKCSCGNSYTESIAAKGHNYTTKVTTPTCTEKGYTTHTCSVCNYSYKDTYVNAKGHKEGEWKVIKDATFTSTGTRTLYCSVCSAAIKSETIPKLEQPKGKVKSVSIGNIELDYKDVLTLHPKIEIDSGVKYTMEYKSSNTSVATVDKNGNVYGVNDWIKNTATITCTVTDEYGNVVTDKCNVTVGYAWWQWIIGIALFGWIWY